MFVDYLVVCVHPFVWEEEAHGNLAMSVQYVCETCHLELTETRGDSLQRKQQL